MKILDKELWNKSFPFLKEMKFFFLCRNLCFFVFPDCRVFVLQTSVIREKNMIEGLSNECFSSESRDDPVPQITAEWCHVPKDDIYGVGAEGEVKGKGVNEKKLLLSKR